jgi:hypothetical protein
MNTPRRTLGTGPTTSTRSTSTEPPGPRRLPAERAEPNALLGDNDEHQAVQMLRGRRTLGTGPADGAS